MENGKSSPSSSFEAAHLIPRAPYSANPARSRAKFRERSLQGLIDNEEIKSGNLKKYGPLGRHHPTRAARARTPVRSRFRIHRPTKVDVR